MKIPLGVKIGYKDYNIEQVDNLNDGTAILYGLVNYDEEKILLNKKYTRNQRECTLIHEVIHAIDDLNEIDLTEEQVVKLGKGMYQFIKDNPHVFEEK